MKLTELTVIHLIDHSDNSSTDNGAFYEELALETAAIAHNCGMGKAYEQRRQKILEAAPDHIAIKKIMTKAIWIRPLISLWHDKLISCSNALLQHMDKLASLSGGLDATELRELCQLFFQRYDRVENIGMLGHIIYANLYARRAELPEDFTKLKINAINIFHENGHKYLIYWASEMKLSLEAAARENDIPVENSRFFEIACSEYAANQAKESRPNRIQKIPALLEKLPGMQAILFKFRASGIFMHGLMKRGARSGKSMSAAQPSSDQQSP